MKETKFRAWDKEAERFAYSDPSPCEDQYCWGFEEGKLKAWAIIEHPGSIHEPPYPSSIEIEEPLMYTGLKDKRGKEIWEGDIVSIVAHMVNIVAPVEFIRGRFCVGGEGWEYSIDARYDTGLHAGVDVETIGNIYENPELTKENP